jgi:hypothetical protein
MKIEPKSDEELIATLRAAYLEYSPLPPEWSPEVEHQPTWPARRSPALILAAAAAVAAIPTLSVVMINQSHSPFSDPAAKPDTAATASKVPTEQRTDPSDLTGNAADGGALRAELYRATNARPDLGAYMLQVTPGERTVTFWATDAPSEVLTELASSSRAAGYTFVEKTLPNPSSRATAIEERLSDAATKIRGVLADSPDSKLAALKIEVPLDTVIVWRTSPTEATDDQLESIAADFGVEIELLDAPISQHEAAKFGNELRQENDRWKQQGFTVNGAYATGSGPIIVVQGDASAASQVLLSSYANILAIELDDGAMLPGSIYGTGD